MAVDADRWSCSRLQDSRRTSRRLEIGRGRPRNTGWRSRSPAGPAEVAHLDHDAAARTRPRRRRPAAGPGRRTASRPGAAGRAAARSSCPAARLMPLPTRPAKRSAAGAVRHAQQQRADQVRRAGLRPPAADHAGLVEPVRGLDPVRAAPAGLVDATGGAWPPRPPAPAPGWRPAAPGRRRRPASSRQAGPGSSSRSRLVRRSVSGRSGQVDAVEPQQVEGHHGHRLAARPARAARRSSPTCIRSASAAKDGTPVAQRDDLAVEQRVRHAAGDRCPVPGKLTRDVPAAAREQPQPGVGDVGQHPHAVPLDLVLPLARQSAEFLRWRASVA